MNLRTKFILWTGILIIVIITLTAALIFDQSKKALKDERSLRGISLAKHLVGMSREPLLLKDDLALHSLVGDIVKNEPDVVYAYVGDLTGKRVYLDTSLEKRDVLLKEILSIKPSGSEKVALQRLEAPYFSDIVDFSLGIVVQKKTLGMAHIGISEKGIKAALAKIRNKIIPFSFLSIVFFVSLAFGLITLAVRPIGYLSSRALAVGEGDLETPIFLEQRDELGHLANSLDWMVKKLKQAHDERIEKEKLKKEMEIARQIQQRLLPRNYPEVEGIEFAALFEPAQEIGGDFYDVFPIDEKRIGFAIGDVAGKSISGALLMVLVRTLLRAEALNEKGPREVLVRLNNFLRAELAEDKRRFVTLQYNVLDIKGRTVTCTSAGHPPPIFISASEKTVKTVQTKGMALGIIEDGRFFKVLTEKKVELAKGDALLLYTDGITDVAYAKDGGYGEEGLIKSLKDCRAIKAHDILSCVKHDLMSYAGAVPIEDDLTMLLIKGK